MAGYIQEGLEEPEGAAALTDFGDFGEADMMDDDNADADADDRDTTDMIDMGLAKRWLKSSGLFAWKETRIYNLSDITCAGVWQHLFYPWRENLWGEGNIPSHPIGQQLG